MESRRDYSAVVNAILSLSENLGIETIAVGIETPSQLAQLQSLDCELGQGYYFSRAMPAETATEWLKQFGEAMRDADADGWIARATGHALSLAEFEDKPDDAPPELRAAG
jgi:predicted signal transduction protein with EAL and GGDEF domain